MMLLVWWTAAVISSGSPSRPNNMASAIRTAYEANRAALRSGTIHFKYSVGSASTVESALDGSWERRFVTEGLYAYSGPRAVFERVYPPDVMAASRQKAGKDHWTSATYSSRLLTNGTLTLWDNVNLSADGKEVRHYAQIDKGTDKFFQDVSVPLGLGNPNPTNFQLGCDIERAVQNRPDWTLSSIEEARGPAGEEIVIVMFELPEGSCEYRVDLEHGAIPRQIRIAHHKTKSAMQIHHEDIRSVAHEAWYPFRQVIFFESDGSAKEFVVERADFSRPPEDRLFRLEFPKPIGILNTAASPMVKYPPQKIWDLAKLPPSDSPGTRRIVPSKPDSPAPEMLGERERDMGTWLPWIAAAAAILVVVGLRLGRRRHG